MSSTRIAVLAGVSLAAMAGTWAGVTDVFGLAPGPVPRVSLALPPSLDMVAFDNEETVIDAAFGPASWLAQQVEAGEGGNPSLSPIESSEPPPPMAHPLTPVQRLSGPVPANTKLADVRGLRVGHSGDKSRVIIDLSASTDFAYSIGRDGKSVSIVLPGAAWKAAAKGSTNVGGRITGYEYQPVDGGSKVTLTASQPVEVVSVEPKPGEGKGYQLVIDLVDAQVAQMRKGGLALWWGEEAPAKVVEAPPPVKEPPAPKVADANAQRGEMAPMADYKKSSSASGDWSGFYAGLQGGYGMARSKAEVGGVALSSRTIGGPEGGLFLGYGQQFGSWYLGAELAGGYAAASGKWPVSGGKYKAEKSWSYTGALRLGAAVSDDALFYLKGGYKAASFKVKADFPDDVPAWNVSARKTLYGPLAGVGFDYKFADNWFLRTEADYTFFKSLKYTDSNGDPGKLSPGDVNFRLGVGYKF